MNDTHQLRAKYWKTQADNLKLFLEAHDLWEQYEAWIFKTKPSKRLDVRYRTPEDRPLDCEAE